MLLDEFRQVKEDVSIDSPEELEGKVCKIHWHFQEKRYSVSLRASNGKFYVVRRRETGNQLFFGKLVMKDVAFQVQPAGAKKAYETGKRNVHASLIGTILFAKYLPEKAVVPCGIPVMYSHSLYPEPEFKLLNFELPSTGWDAGITDMPGIRSAEMVALGCTAFDKAERHPMMLATGEIELT